MFLNYIYNIISKDIFPEDDMQSKNEITCTCIYDVRTFCTHQTRFLDRVFPRSGQRFLETIGRRFALHETHKKYFFRLVVQGKRPCLKFVFFSYINTEFRTTRRLVYAYMYIVNEVV